MNERIKELRKTLKLTQQQFADKIGVKQNTVATYEMGRNAPNDTVINLICREFGVNELWLRAGDGDMFQRLSRSEEISAFVGKTLAGKAEDEFKRRLMSTLSRLSEAEWAALESVADKFIEEYKEEQE